MILTSVVSLAATGEMAASLQQQSVGARASEYSVSYSGVANFPNVPVVSLASVPAGTASCAASINFVGGTWTSGAIALNGSTCTTGQFAVELGFVGASTLTSETDTFTVWSTFTDGAGTVHTGSASLAVVVGSGSNGSQGVDVFVDFGQSGPVAALSSLSVVVA